MANIKAIETYYNGYKFRSRLEARWAVFFDACGVKYEYEPEGFDLGDGIMYLPDFLLHNVEGRAYGDLYVEVKGQMNDSDAEKILRFCKLHSILIVNSVPFMNMHGYFMNEIINEISYAAYNSWEDEDTIFNAQHVRWPSPFNFETIDQDYFGAIPGVDVNGAFCLFGDDCNYLMDMDKEATEKAYKAAKQARFEHGEKPFSY